MVKVPGSDQLRSWAWWAKQIPLVVCIAVFILHFSVLARYTVNLPNLDDWALIADSNHPASVDLLWLHRQHNEHRTATTKLWVSLQYYVNGWNVRTHQLLNFVWWGGVLAFIIFLVRRLMPEAPTWLMLAFTVFLLSTLIWIEHFCAYPIAVHFWLLFFLLAVYCLFREPLAWPSLVIGCVSAGLSIYSFAAGAVTAIVMLAGFALFKTIRIWQSREARGRELAQLFFVLVVIGGAIGSWFIGFFRPSHHPGWVWPYRRLFWSVYANIISFSFGVERVSTKVGVIFFLAVIIPVAGILWQRRGRLTPQHWAWFTIIFALLANLAAVSIGRAGFGVTVSKVLEYAEHGMPLILLTAANWWVFLRGQPKLRAVVLIVLWIVCFRAFLNNWNFKVYREQASLRQAGAACVQAYYAGTGNGVCPTVFHPTLSLAPILEHAKKLNASFYQELSVPAKPDRESPTR